MFELINFVVRQEIIINHLYFSVYMVEFVDIVDKNDKVIDSVPYAEMREKNLLHRGSHILIFNNKGEMLISKRQINKKNHPGKLEPGFGGAMTTGETYEENGIRELEEEGGIKGVALKFLFKYLYEDDQTRVISKLYTCTYDGKITLQEEEVSDYFWITIPKLKGMMQNKESEFSPQAIDMLNRYFKIIGS
jgi:isopentenyldiphosphate isomerase